MAREARDDTPPGGISRRDIVRERLVSSAYEGVLLGVAVVVTTVWAVANMVQIVLPDHTVPGSVNAIMGTVAAGLFGGAVFAGLRRVRNGQGGE